METSMLYLQMERWMTYAKQTKTSRGKKIKSKPKTRQDKTIQYNTREKQNKTKQNKTSKQNKEHFEGTVITIQWNLNY